MSTMGGDDAVELNTNTALQPNADAPGKRLQTLHNPLIFFFAALCGFCVASFKTIARGIWANAWIIVLCLILSALAGYLLNGFLEDNDSVYIASGTIRILPTPTFDSAHPVQVEDSQELEMHKATVAQRFRSDFLIDDIMKNSDNPIRSTRWWSLTCNSDLARAHELLRQNLQIDPMPGSSLMRISFATSDKADTAVLVTTLVDRAMEEDRDFLRDRCDTDRKRIYDLKNRYEITLRNAVGDVREKIDELARLGADPVGQIVAGGYSAGPKETEVNARVNERVALEATRFDIERSTAELKEMKDKVPPQVQRMIDEDRDIASVQETLSHISMRLIDAGDRPTTRGASVDQLEKVQGLWERKLDDLKAQKLAQYLGEYSAQLTASKNAVDKKLDHCNSQIALLQTELADIANKTLALRDRQNDVSFYREQVKQYDGLLTDVDQVIRQDAIGSMTWLARPRTPTQREFPDLKVIMTLAMVIGLLIGLAIAFVRELRKWDLHPAAGPIQ